MKRLTLLLILLEILLAARAAAAAPMLPVQPVVHFPFATGTSAASAHTLITATNFDQSRLTNPFSVSRWVNALGGVFVAFGSQPPNQETTVDAAVANDAYWAVSFTLAPQTVVSSLVVSFVSSRGAGSQHCDLCAHELRCSKAVQVSCSMQSFDTCFFTFKLSRITRVCATIE
jgi:hypothetical protein